MTVTTIKATEGLIRWHYLPWALSAIAVMIAAIVADNLWFLDYVHVFSSLLWTGIDLFMGFVLGPVLRRVDLTVRRDIMRRLTPRTLFLMPTVSIISGTSVVPRDQVRLHGSGVAGVWLDGRGTYSGCVDDGTRPRVLNASQCIRLRRIAEG